MRNKWSSIKKRQKHAAKLRKTKREAPEALVVTAVEDNQTEAVDAISAEAVDAISADDGNEPDVIAPAVADDETVDEDNETEAIEIEAVDEDNEAEAAPIDDESE